MRAFITVIGKDTVGIIAKATVSLETLSDELEALGNEMGLKIHVMHEDIFNSMHRI